MEQYQIEYQIITMNNFQQSFLQRWDLKSCPSFMDPTLHHGHKNGYTVPCIFCLLPHKRKETYIRVFTQIKSWLDAVTQPLEFKTFLSDFEQGAYLAVPVVFPGMESEGCFFI